jgi:hypothetical protein
MSTSERLRNQAPAWLFVIALACVPAYTQEVVDIAGVFNEGVQMPEPEKRPPALPVKKLPPKARGNVHEGSKDLQKRISATYRSDHPAYAIARAAALRKAKG